MRLEKSVLIGAPPRSVFEALTVPSRIVRHFPFERVESDRREGGDITFYGAIEGEVFTDYGRIIKYAEPTAFEYRYWSSNHGTERTLENELEIRYALVENGAGTSLQITHDRIRSEDYLKVMDGAWDMVLSGLKQSLEARL